MPACGEFLPTTSGSLVVMARRVSEPVPTPIKILSPSPKLSDRKLCAIDSGVEEAEEDEDGEGTLPRCAAEAPPPSNDNDEEAERE